MSKLKSDKNVREQLQEYLISNDSIAEIDIYGKTVTRTLKNIPVVLLKAKHVVLAVYDVIEGQKIPCDKIGVSEPDNVTELPLEPHPDAVPEGMPLEEAVELWNDSKADLEVRNEPVTDTEYNKVVSETHSKGFQLTEEEAAEYQKAVEADLVDESEDWYEDEETEVDEGEEDNDGK